MQYQQPNENPGADRMQLREILVRLVLRIGGHVRDHRDLRDMHRVQVDPDAIGIRRIGRNIDQPVSVMKSIST